MRECSVSAECHRKNQQHDVAGSSDSPRLSVFVCYKVQIAEYGVTVYRAGSGV